MIIYLCLSGNAASRVIDTANLKNFLNVFSMGSTRNFLLSSGEPDP